MDDETDFLNFFMTLPNVLTRRNPYIFITESNPLRAVDVSAGAKIIDQLDYIYGASLDSKEIVETSILAFADFNSQQGLQLASETFAFLVSE